MSIKSIVQFFYLNFGLALMAVNIHFFLVPNQLAAGGLGGLTVVLHHFFPGLSIGPLMAALNIILFCFGFFFLGPTFGIKTIYASFSLTIMVWGLEKIIPLAKPITEDLLIQLIIGTVIATIGLVIVFQQNASTGGMDLVGMILNKYLSVDIGVAVLAADFFIAFLSVFAFGFEKGMYSLLGIILRGVMIDYIMHKFNVKKEVVIISNNCDLIKSFIVTKLGRGATVHEAKGAFTDDRKEVITIVVKRHEFTLLKRYIHQVDKKAFITVHEMSEVSGGWI